MSESDDIPEDMLKAAEKLAYDVWMARELREEDEAIALIVRAILAERERCARIMDRFTCGLCGMDGKAAAAIIRRPT